MRVLMRTMVLQTTTKKGSCFPLGLLTTSNISESDDESISDIIKASHAEVLQELEADDADDEERVSAAKGEMRTKHEVTDDRGPIDLGHVSISSSATIETLGTVEYLLESIATVKANVTGDYSVLDEGSIIVTDSREAVGMVKLLLFCLSNCLDFRNFWTC
jgi:H/ACA ribonucleoprotein complex non-core subunit NAF1